MAIQTETTVSIMYGEDVADTVGLSNTLNTYLSEEIEDYIYCGCYNNVLAGNLFEYVTTAGSYDVWNKLNDKFMPYETDAVTGTYMEMLPGDGSYSVTEEKGRYVGTIWVTNVDNYGYDNNITQGNASHYKIITEWDARNYYVEHKGNFSQVDSYGATSWDDENAGLYNYDFSNEELHYIYDDEGTKQDINLYGVLSVFPYTVYVDSNSGLLYIVKMSTSLLGPGFRCHISPNWNAGYSLLNFTGNNTAENSLSITYNCLNFGSSFTDEGGSSHNWLYPTSHVTYKYSKCDKKFKARTYFTVLEFQVAYYFEEAEELLWLFAAGGLKFKVNGTMYKPLISENVVYDYTDDMTAESEIDDYTGSNKHDIPVTPPTPPEPPTPEGDDFDDHEMGAGSGISGMANLWLLTKSQLNDLHSSFNSAPGGFDPMNSLISVMGLGVAPNYLFNDIEVITPINIRKSDGTSWSTGVEGHIVDAQKSAFQFTGITVNRKYNNFLDFSPYAIHEIFIPMCGWLTLPDIAVDRSITVTYLPDVESLKCRAVVSVVDNSGNRCVIGEKDGIMGADVPFTNTGHSLYVGEAIINGMNVAGEVITGAIGAGFTKTNAKGGTYRPYEGFTVGMGGTLPGAIGNAIVSGQTNRTHYMTGNGTRIGFSDGENIQIKSTYHNIDKPSNYDHTVGKVCNKTGALSEFHGFTVCDNPHINISALEEEKSEIKALLEQGVILPSGE